MFDSQICTLQSGNSQTSFASGVVQQSEETALQQAKIFRCSVDGTTIDLRVAISTGRDLGHEDRFISPLLTPLPNSVLSDFLCQSWPSVLCCLCSYSFSERWHSQALACDRRAKQNTGYFIKKTILLSRVTRPTC